MTRHEVVNGCPTSTSFNFKKISQIIVKKDMLILRIEDFQYSFQTIHFNLHPSLLHSSMYLEERRSMGFDWIITLIQEFFFSSWSALCIHYRDSTNDLNYTKCWKKNSLIAWYIAIFRCIAALWSELCDHLNLQ